MTDPLHGFEFDRYALDDEHRALELRSTADAARFSDDPGLRGAQLWAAGVLGRLGMLIAAEVEVVGQEHGCDRRRRRATQQDIDWLIAQQVGEVMPIDGCGVSAFELGPLDTDPRRQRFADYPGLTVTVPASQAKRIRALMLQTLNGLQADVATSKEPS